VSDPSHPVKAGSLDTPTECRSVAASGDRVYLADEGTGLLIINAADPGNPVQAGVFETIGNCRGIALDEPFAYLADQSAGLRVVDVSDPTTPVLAGYFDPGGESGAYGVGLNNGLVYLMCGDYGIYLIRFEGSNEVGSRQSLLPLEINLAQNHPNPFNPSTVIPFTLGRQGRVTVSVFDVTGRRVADLLDGEMPAGRHSVSFHAEGLGSGVYFYSLKSAGRCLYRKMLLLQ